MTTIGIDFGTTNSAAAVWTPQGAQIIDMVDGKDSLPSVVAQTTAGVMIGRPALSQIHDNPAYTFRNIKRHLGREFSEEVDSWQLAAGEDDKVWWKGPNGLVSGPQLAAEILKGLLLSAESFLGAPPTGAVITVPVGFHEPQKAAIREAAVLAGLPPARVELYEEPVAAARAYGIDRAKFARVMVLDCGGGTFDVAILHIGEGAVVERQHGGLADRGGVDIDRLIVQHCDRILTAAGHDIGEKPFNQARLERAAEEAKIFLSSQAETKIYIDHFLMTQEGIQSFKQVLTRDQLEEIAAHIIREMIDEARATLERAGLKRNQLDHIILVGGQTRMPLISAAVEEVFGRKPESGQRPEYAVALGAAIRAAEIDGRLPPQAINRIASSSVGIKRENGAYVALIPKGTQLPAEKQFVVTTAADGQAACTIVVCEGERAQADFNTLITRHSALVEAGDAGAVDVEGVIARDETGALSLKVNGELVYPRGE